jgi:NDP-sugar pyrophosphorylase family protein
MTIQCVILAGGLATRLTAITSELPKSLVPVAGRPFADHQLSWLAGQGVTDVVYCIGHLGEQIRAFVGDGSRWGLRVVYVDEGSRLRGTAGALRLAYDQGVLAPEFATLYGDSYLAVGVTDVAADFADRRPQALMTVFENRGRFGASNARFEDGRVVRYEKDVRDPAAAGMHYIDYGLSVIDRDAVLPDVPPDETIDLATVFGGLSDQGALAGYEVFERFYEIGSPGGLAELEARLTAQTGSGGRG